MVQIGEKKYLGTMGVEAEKFKKKWRREKGGGHTSNEESDEKPDNATFGDFLIKEKSRRNSRPSIT